MKPTALPSWLWRALAGTVLALTFALYTRPDFMVDLAQQVWGCF